MSAGGATGPTAWSMTGRAVPPAVAAADFILVRNACASRGAAWTAAQDAILNRAGLSAARAAITAWPGYAPTPLVALEGLAARANIAEIHYKDESGRFGLGSFKALGGAYAVARLVQRRLAAELGRAVSMAEIAEGSLARRGAPLTVCCATGGNHGRAVAWGAQRFGSACVIFLHDTVSEGRRRAIEAFGAEVRRCRGNYDDSVRAAQEVAAREGWTVVSDTSWPGYTDIPKDVMQGYELMADEAFDQLAAPPTHVVLQTGVGGMAAAVAANAKRRWGAERPRIVLTDPDRAACWVESFRAGRPVAVRGDPGTVMAGLACGEVSLLAWEILKDHADAAIALPDEAALSMMRLLARGYAGDPPLVAGDSAVAGLAGLMAAAAHPEARTALDLDARSRVLVFGTEGDTDPDHYASIVGRPAREVRAAAQ